jgi:arsenate reductase (thioredoxin)
MLGGMTCDECSVVRPGADPDLPLGVQAMAEVGIDITAEHPKTLDVEDVRASDVVITMGCGDTCPIFPCKRYDDWGLDDPAGQDIETVRRMRDEIRDRIQTLTDQLLLSTSRDPPVR